MAEQQFYYPEGPYGPVCDVEVQQPDAAGGARALGDLFAAAAATETIAGPFDFNEFANNFASVICDKDPETGELSNCRVVYDREFGDGYNGSDCINNNGECFDWGAVSTGRFGIQDDFYIPLLGPYTCRPYDEDINVRPVTFLQPDGTEITKYTIQKSSPVTYPVNAIIGNTTSSGLSAKFSQDGRSLIISGDGNGNATLRLEWDDDPNTAGTALGSIEINGSVWTQSGETGSAEYTIEVSGGQTYTLNFTNLNSANSVINVNSARTSMCLYDGDADDCNATFSIQGIDGGGTSTVSLWTDTADKYAVWTNPAQCTLPCLEQTVTYQVNFPTTNTYFFECAADDTGAVYFDDESTPFVTMGTPTMVNPEIFPNAIGPVIVPKQITAGNHTITVKVTNAVLPELESESLYIDNSVTWGTITPGAGTAIRTELDGFVNTAGGVEEEMLGFDVPSDSPTAKYLSFGTINPTTSVVYTRVADITMNLTGTERLIFSVIAGSDSNGGERPNDVGDTWDVSFDGGSTWIKVAPSKQYANVSFDEYDRTYGNWYDFSVSVPSSARVENFTIKFRSGGDIPEVGGTYNGLAGAAFAAAYANSGDVFGLYKIQKVSNVPRGCDNPGPTSLNWRYNPGGWYIKACAGCPCTEADNLPWVKSGPHHAWNDLMNTYAVWPSSFDTLVDSPQSLTYYVYVFVDDTLTLEYAADNNMTITWDGTQVASTSSFTSTASTTLSVDAGLHVLEMSVTNVSNSNGNNSWSNNPAGGAWLLTDSNGDKIRSSLDLSTSSDANLVWHTRMDTGYEYITTVTDLTTPNAQ